MTLPTSAAYLAPLDLPLQTRLSAQTGRKDAFRAFEPESGLLSSSEPQIKLAAASRFGLRALDLTIAFAALVFFAPLMILIAIYVALSNGGGILYRQQRIGLGGKAFTCLKFRTMYSNGDEILARHLANNPAACEEWRLTQKLRNDPRVIPFGALLRKASLDELPQLFNVIGGTMSIVGPRPIVASETHRYGRYLQEYSRVRPGITGLWQVSGRNNTTYRRRIACDVAYVRTKSPLNDLRIIARTIPAVILGKGAY